MIRSRQGLVLSASLAPITVGPLYGFRLERRDPFTDPVTVSLVTATGGKGDRFVVPHDETGWIAFPDGATRAEFSTTSAQAISVDLWWGDGAWDVAGTHTPEIGRQLGDATSAAPTGNPVVALSGVRVREVIVGFINSSPVLNRNCYLDVLFNGVVVTTFPLGAVGPATTTTLVVSIGHGATAAPVFAGLATLAVPFAVPGDFRLRMDGAVADLLAYIYAWGR